VKHFLLLVGMLGESARLELSETLIRFESTSIPHNVGVTAGENTFHRHSALPFSQCPEGGRFRIGPFAGEAAANGLHDSSGATA